MSHLKCRAALATGIASATTAVLGLAPLPAHAQTYPGAGMAMPQAMPSPGFASGAPGFGVARPMTAAPMPMMTPMPMRTYTPAFGMRPTYNQFYGQPSYNQSYGSYGQPSYERRTYEQPSYERSTESDAPSSNDISSYPFRVRHRTSGYPAGDLGQGTVSPDRRTFPRDLRTEPTAPLATTGTTYLNRPQGRVILPVRPFSGDDNRRVISPSTPPAVYNNTNNGYVYAPQAPVTTLGGPALLGGYYYGGYCNTYDGSGTYPSVYSAYTGFPSYIYSLGVSYQTLGGPPVYITDPLPFNPPQYQATYNQTNYYVTNEAQADQIADGGAPAKRAVHQALPADSYQAAFADIERAWTDGNFGLLKNHLRSSDTKVSVFLSSKYKYSLDSSDFGQITRDAFDRLDTVSFRFTRLRKAKNGDVTAYGKHVYRVTSGDDKTAGTASDNTVPFDSSSDGSAPSADTTVDNDPVGNAKTVYVSYTLRHGDDGWYITAVDSASDPLVKEAE